MGELARDLPVSRPAVSQHLRVLKEAGLVSERKDGTRRLYRIEPDAVAELRAYFDGFWSKALAAFKAAAESEGKEQRMSSAETIVEPVRRSVVVDRSVEDAFRVFTQGIGEWWALEKHSLSLDRTGAPAETAVLEGEVGGRLYERMSDGTEADWGKLLLWEPPHRVAFEWHVTGTPTEVDVRFTAEGDATRVELVHSGFDRLEDAERRRAGYDEGWGLGLERFAEVANAG